MGRMLRTRALPNSSALVLADFDITVTDAAGNVDHITYSQGGNTFARPVCPTG